MIAGGAEIEHGKQVGRLAGRSQNRSHAAFERGDFGGNGVVGGIGKTGIEIAVVLKVEHLAHRVAAVVFIGGALHDRQHDGFFIAGLVAGADAFGRNFIIFHLTAPFHHRIR